MVSPYVGIGESKVIEPLFKANKAHLYTGGSISESHHTSDPSVRDYGTVCGIEVEGRLVRTREDTPAELCENCISAAEARDIEF